MIIIPPSGSFIEEHGEQVILFCTENGQCFMKQIKTTAEVISTWFGDTLNCS